MGKSAIVLILSYFPPKLQISTCGPICIRFHFQRQHHNEKMCSVPLTAVSTDHFLLNEVWGFWKKTTYATFSLHYVYFVCSFYYYFVESCGWACFLNLLVQLASFAEGQRSMRLKILCDKEKSISDIFIFHISYSWCNNNYIRAHFLLNLFKYLLTFLVLVEELSFYFVLNCYFLKRAICCISARL